MTNEIEEKLKLPSIGLLVAGILNLLLGIYFIFSVVLQVAMGYTDRAFASDAERYGFLVGFYAMGVFGLLGLIIAPIIIFGALKMRKGEKYGLSKWASILAIVPATGCCVPLSLPFGIWAFFTLRKPEIIEHFHQKP